MFKQKIVVISGGYEFSFHRSEIEALEVLNNKDDNFCLLHDQKSILGQVISASKKHYKVEIDGERFDVQIKNELDLMLDHLGLNKPKLNKIKTIKAPMPGLVIEINVSEGQMLQENDKVLILEAMKMENIIKIPHDAVVKKVNVSNGQAVDKGQVLIELE